MLLGNYYPTNPNIPIKNVIQIWTGRPPPMEELQELTHNIYYEAASSTSALVAKLILDGGSPNNYNFLLYLLAAPIVFYANNLANNQGSQLDREMILKLSTRFNWDTAKQNKVYAKIQYLQKNYFSAQIENDAALHKNVDIISNMSRLFRVALVQVPVDMNVS